MLLKHIYLQIMEDIIVIRQILTLHPNKKFNSAYYMKNRYIVLRVCLITISSFSNALNPYEIMIDLLKLGNSYASIHGTDGCKID